jgi:CHAT domain-containing protein
VGDWAEDARRRLNGLRDKLKKTEGRSSPPLLGSRELARELARSSTDLKDTFDARIEDYADLAVREWFPAAFPVGAADGEGRKESRAALRFLAELAIEKHDDPWFSDILSSSSSKEFPAAVAALSLSRQANDVGDYVVARRLALQAKRLFHAGGGLAGELGARVEDLYALHLSHDGENCLPAAEAASEYIEQSAYAWLQVQSRLEHAMCLGIMGNYGEAQRRIEAAMELAKTRGYGSVYLRGLGFASDLASTIGDVRTGWSRAYAGLASFWSGTYRPMLGYNLYTDLDTAAESGRQPHLQVAIWDQALALLDSQKDPLLGAMAHSWMAKAAGAAGMPDVAEREFAAASHGFAASPQTQATQNDWVEAETGLAEIESRRGNRARAYERLRQIESGIHLLSNQYVAIRYYATLGSVESGLGLAEAERSQRAAVSLAERSLKTLHTDRERSVWNDEVSEAYRSLIRRELDRGDSQSALEIWEWFRGAVLRGREDEKASWVTAREDHRLSAAALAEGPPLPRLNEVAFSFSTLTDETVVSYGLFADEYWIWTYDNRGMIAIKGSASAAEIESLASRFVQLCSNPDSDRSALQRDGSRLYELLIDPIQGRLFGRRVLIVESDGVLGRIPMEALLARNGRYVVDQIPIIISPGLYYRRAARTKSELSSAVKALVVAVPAPLGTSSYGMLPLADASDEAQIVARGFGSAHFVQGSEATLDAVGGLMRGVGVFHFAGHAMSSADGIGLVLADTDPGNQPKLLNAAFLTPERIHAMELAVLSACATEASFSETHGAADDLGMAFLAGGVSHVVGSRWNVDSASTAYLMQRFYQSLFSGKSVAESLRSGQVAVRSRPEWAHPYFWASFEALGAT